MMKKWFPLLLSGILLIGCTTNAVPSLPTEPPAESETPSATTSTVSAIPEIVEENKDDYYAHYPAEMMDKIEQAAIRLSLPDRHTTVLAGHLDEETFAITVDAENFDFSFYLNGTTAYLSGNTGEAPFQGKLNLGSFATAVSSFTNIKLVNADDFNNTVASLRYRETRNGYDLCTASYQGNEFRLYFAENDHRLMYMENTDGSATFEVIYSGLTIPEDLKDAEEIDLNKAIEQLTKLSEQLNTIMQ